MEFISKNVSKVKNDEKIKKIEKLLRDYIKPTDFDTRHSGSDIIKRKKNFNLLCSQVEIQSGIQIHNYTTYRFFSTLEVIQKREPPAIPGSF